MTSKQERMMRFTEERRANLLRPTAAQERDRLLAENAELRHLCEKALTRSAIVHPDFADEIRAALAGGKA